MTEDQDNEDDNEEEIESEEQDFLEELEEHAEQDLQEASGDIVIDPSVIFAILKKNNGNLENCVNFLRGTGWKGNRATLVRFINKHPVLAAYFRDGSPIVHDTSPNEMQALTATVRLPSMGLNESEAISQMASSELMDPDYIAAKGLEGIGFKAEEIERMLSLAQFASHGFSRTIDYAYGNMMASLFRMNDEAERIRVEILQNNETVERFQVMDSGAVVRFNGPRYTEEEKLEYQKQYIMLLQEARKVSEAATQAGAIRIKSKINMNEAEAASGNGTRKKLKKVK